MSVESLFGAEGLIAALNRAVFAPLGAGLLVFRELVAFGLEVAAEELAVEVKARGQVFDHAFEGEIPPRRLVETTPALWA